jgi:hypothetical protein
LPFSPSRGGVTSALGLTSETGCQWLPACSCWRLARCVHVGAASVVAGAGVRSSVAHCVQPGLMSAGTALGSSERGWRLWVRRSRPSGMGRGAA